MPAKKSFSEMSPSRRLLTGLILLASVMLVSAAEYHLGRRSSSKLRGGKPLWRLLCLNALGAIGYPRWGRVPGG